MTTLSRADWIGRRGMLAALFGLVFVYTLGFAHTGPLHAQSEDSGPPVDLQLVLAVDVSGSVNDVRFELQKRGYVQAFRDPRVLRAIETGGSHGIAVTMVQWTGPAMQVQVLPWTHVRDEAAMHALAGRIEAAPRQLFGGGTSLSGAIDNAMEMLSRSPFTGGRRVIDISGDGANNRGRPAAEARDAAIQAGVTINGLPILELEPNLDEYYRNNVIGGPNAFMVVAEGFAEFGEAILKKLVTEIAGGPSPRLQVGRQADLR